MDAYTVVCVCVFVCSRVLFVHGLLNSRQIFMNMHNSNKIYELVRKVFFFRALRSYVSLCFRAPSSSNRSIVPFAKFVRHLLCIQFIEDDLCTSTFYNAFIISQYFHTIE